MPYDHPVPFDHAMPARWVPDLLIDAAARRPAAPLIDFLGRRFTYADVLDSARRAASGFRSMGLGPGSTIGLFLPNCPHYVVACYGAMLAGARVANFSPLYTVDELRTQVEDSETDAMVTLDVAALFPTIRAVQETSRLRTLIVGNVAEVLPAAKAVGYRLLKRSERAAVPWGPDVRRYADLLHHSPLAIPADRPSLDEVALLQYTGGTTGLPKGAMLTHRNLSVNAAQVDSIDDQRHAEDRILGALPLFHIFAHTCIMNRTILRGGMMVLLPRFEVEAALRAVARTRVTAMPGVPTMYRAMLDHPGFGAFDLSSLRICISGGAPMPEPLKNAFVQATGARLVEGYGLTESAGVVSANPYRTGGRPGSIGQPVPGTEMKLLDREDASRDAAPGEPGELAFRGPQRLAGYWRRADHGLTDDGWFRTGDVATVDADGYWTIVDRLKDLILVGGFNVFPSHIEDALYQHPAVKEAIVIGVADPYHGERPKAFCTLHEGLRATADELRDAVNKRVGKHERVVAVEIRAALPKTMIGKLSRKELVAEEREKAAARNAA